MDMAINMESVELGSTKNHLLFKGYAASLDNFNKYKFDYTGVDLTSTSGLTNKQLERLRKKLMKDFDYPPFDEDTAKEILGNFKQYRITM
jgi:F0F1-type ATP synthase delta subunit